MGVDFVHYAIIGVAITEKDEVKRFFALEETHVDFMEQYSDNTYSQEITPTDSGIHIIVDGMCGKYVVVGKIVAKGVSEEGLEFTGISFADIKQQYKDIYPKVKEIDEALRTKFGGLDPQVFVFTHAH